MHQEWKKQYNCKLPVMKVQQMTWTSSRRCSQSTHSMCLVQGSSIIPLSPNRCSAVRSHTRLSILVHKNRSRILILVPLCVFLVAVNRLMIEIWKQHLPKYVEVNSERKLLRSSWLPVQRTPLKWKRDGEKRLKVM